MIYNQVEKSTKNQVWAHPVESYDDVIIILYVSTTSVSSILEQVRTCPNQGLWLVESYDDDISTDVSPTSDSSILDQSEHVQIKASDWSRVRQQDYK